MGGGGEVGMIDIKEEGTEARSAAEAKKAIYKKAFKVRERGDGGRYCCAGCRGRVEGIWGKFECML
jgi:hypothetical protein